MQGWDPASPPTPCPPAIDGSDCPASGVKAPNSLCIDDVLDGAAAGGYQPVEDQDARR